jgi:hypothetical protein
MFTRSLFKSVFWVEDVKRSPVKGCFSWRHIIPQNESEECKKELMLFRKSVFAFNVKDKAAGGHIHKDSSGKYDQIGFCVVSINIWWKCVMFLCLIPLLWLFVRRVIRIIKYQLVNVFQNGGFFRTMKIM